MRGIRSHVAIQRRAHDRGDQPRHAEHVMAVLFFSGGKPSIRIPWLAGWSPPLATPWITRNRISCSRLAARPHSTDATVKTAMDRRKYLRRPRWAESQPVIGSSSPQPRVAGIRPRRLVPGCLALVPGFGL